VEEVKLQAHKEAVGVFTDGSMDECGNAGEVWYVGAGGGRRREVGKQGGIGDGGGSVGRRSGGGEWGFADSA